MASRKLVVELVGDSRSLDRTFQKSTRNAKSFSAQMDKSARSVQGFSKGLVGGFAGAAAFNVLLSGLKDVIGLAAESQQILGQTSVAVESAGFSWERYGKRIETAIQAQSQFGFDDEALMQSFSLFIRTSDSVSEALRRNQIAMDVSRARFIDLETATNLVNKAALGQAGALRRVGIDARNGASGVELLAMLEREFGGAAQAASGDAATAMERFQVSVENAKEAIGTKLLPAMTVLADTTTNVVNGLNDIGDAVERLDGMTANIGINVNLGGRGAEFVLAILAGKVSSLFKGKGGTAAKALQASRARLEGVHDRPTPGDIRGRGGGGGGREGGLTASQRAAQRNRWFDARIARELDRAQDLSASKQVARLKAIAKEVRARLAVTKDATRRLTLEDQLLDIQRQQQAVMEGQASAAGDLVDKIKAANDALKERAEAIKSAVLERLQRRQTDVLNKRALDEAKEQLRIARMIGTPTGIKAALQGLQDVRFDMERTRLENAPATLTRGGQFSYGGVIVNINGITDPEAVAKKVAEVLQRRTKRTTTQMRGAAA